MAEILPIRRKTLYNQLILNFEDPKQLRFNSAVYAISYSTVPAFHWAKITITTPTPTSATNHFHKVDADRGVSDVIARCESIAALV